MEELLAAGGERCATNQILYNFARRGAEFDLLPFLAERKIPAMAYSPVEQGRLPSTGVLAEIAKRHGASVPQIALAFLLRRKDLIVIPKASSIDMCARITRRSPSRSRPRSLRRSTAPSRRLGARRRSTCCEGVASPRAFTRAWI